MKAREVFALEHRHSKALLCDQGRKLSAGGTAANDDNVNWTGRHRCSRHANTLGLTMLAMQVRACPDKGDWLVYSRACPLYPDRLQAADQISTTATDLCPVTWRGRRKTSENVPARSPTLPNNASAIAMQYRSGGGSGPRVVKKTLPMAATPMASADLLDRGDHARRRAGGMSWHAAQHRRDQGREHQPLTEAVEPQQRCQLENGHIRAAQLEPRG